MPSVKAGVGEERVWCAVMAAELRISASVPSGESGPLGLTAAIGRPRPHSCLRPGTVWLRQLSRKPVYVLRHGNRFQCPGVLALWSGRVALRG